MLLNNYESVFTADTASILSAITIFEARGGIL